MKKCPVCHQISPADDLFCPDDGATLVPVSASPPPPDRMRISTETKTQVTQSPAVGSPSNNSQNSKRLYAVIGVLSLALLAMIGLNFLPKAAEIAQTGKDLRAEESIGEAVQTSVSFSNENKTGSAPKSAYVPNSTAITSNMTPMNSNAAFSPPPPAIKNINPGGRWSGDWSTATGAYLTIKVDLQTDGSGRTGGQIEWTLQRTPRTDKMDKIGLSAIEYVSGEYNSTTQVLTLKGYAKNDPYDVLVMLDDYRLNLSDDNRRLTGAARNGGKWNGRVNLSRFR